MISAAAAPVKRHHRARRPNHQNRTNPSLSKSNEQDARLCTLFHNTTEGAAYARERKQEQTLFEDLRHGYECRKKENLENYEKSDRKVIKSAKRSEKKFKMKIGGIRSALTKKIIKTKRLGTPKLCWANQVKLEFRGHFGGQKAQKHKITINQ